MTVDLTRKVALVPGGSRGAGRGMVLAIVEHWPPGFGEAVGAALCVASPSASFTTRRTLRHDADAR